ncbi:MAG: hypothetical protein ACM359_20780 [Bacillota bacterium]
MHSQSALVIARAGKARRLPELPWLASRYHVRVTDWILFCDDGWRDILAGHAGLWTVYEHKLLTSVYLHRPGLIAVVSHPGYCMGEDAAFAGQDEVRRLAERLNWYSLPATIMGFWTNPWWGLEQVIEPEAMEPSEEAEVVT